MDITPLFIRIIKESGNLQHDLKPKQETFYDKLESEINTLSNSIKKTINYTSILRKQQLILKLQDSVSLLGNIELETNDDERKHFDGIKKILLHRIYNIQLKINNKKNEFVAQNIELKPEGEGKSIQMQDIKQDNKNITKNLYEIQNIQNMITTHLMEQDERIDVIMERIPSVDVVKVNIANTKSVLRRFLCVFINCSSFILLYFYYYKR